jgi:uncharacterized protein (DUF1501 family)
MKRRDFIKNMPLAVVPFFSNRLFAEVMPVSLEDYAYFNNVIGEDRVLVIVQMDGGNDGLNTVLPLDQYTNLALARPNILVPDTSALQLGNFQTGLHPAMTGLKSLYDQNRLCVVQGVSYASPNQSHFRSGDIWVSGSDANSVLDTGWLGRYLEYYYPNFPAAYPNATMPDPLSIQIGSTLSRGLLGYSISTGQAVPSNFNGSITQLQSYANSSNPGGNAGTEISFLRNQQIYANQYANAIVNAWNGGTNSIAYPASPTGVGNALGNQLRIVARLIKGGLKTKVFWVRAGGYDTHSNQVNAGNTATGTHANLLQELSDAIYTFMTDVTNMGLEERVMGMTFSEFGRRIKVNGSGGTDHGAGGPMFIFGKYVNPTVLGTNAVISATTATSAVVPVQFDFKSVYQGLLQGWFCVPAVDTATFLGTQSPEIVTNTSCLGLVLPIELLRFTVEKANQKDVHIEWITATEQSVVRFEVERSIDGVSFRKIDAKKAVGHSHVASRYETLDRNVPLEKATTFYYRLRVIEEDGSETFTEIKTVTFDQNEKGISAEVFPNPIQNGTIHMVLKGSFQTESVTEITLTDSFGRRLIELSKENYGAGQQIDLELPNAASGVYFLSIINAQQTYTQRVVLQQ